MALFDQKIIRLYRIVKVRIKIYSDWHDGKNIEGERSGNTSSKYVLKSIVIGTFENFLNQSTKSDVKVRIKIYSDWHRSEFANMGVI